MEGVRTSLSRNRLCLTSVRRGFSLRFERLLPPKSPILGDFEPEILAQSPSLVGDLADYLQGNLLQKAVQTTTQLIQERVETADLPFDLSPYFERISHSQRWVAREMTELGLRLRQARQGEVLRSPRVILDAPVSFRVTELGTRGTLEGLIASPLTDCRLNLDEMRQEYRVRGLGYPWEVEVEEITFVVEAEGSILTFLAGFPDSVIEKARVALEQLAHELYEPIEGG